MPKVWPLMDKVELKIDWATYEAAKYACEHWHYSGSLSSGRNVYVGAWERGKFIGVIIFGIGSGNVTNGKRYGLARSHEMAELTRIALSKHETPVSRIVKIAIQFIKRQSPGLRMIISMADPVHGHVGGIYQAGNWIYTGTTKPDVQYYRDGKWMHHRTATSKGSAKGLPSRPLPGKHRYLMPLDDEMRKQIEPLRKPYPKRVTKATSGDQSGGGGAIPTHALQDKRDKQAIGGDHPHSDGAAPIVTLQDKEV